MFFFQSPFYQLTEYSPTVSPPLSTAVLERVCLYTLQCCSFYMQKCPKSNTPLKYELTAILKHQAIPGQQHSSNLDVYFLGFFFSSHLNAKVTDLAILMFNTGKKKKKRPH